MTGGTPGRRPRGVPGVAAVRLRLAEVGRFGVVGVTNFLLDVGLFNLLLLTTLTGRPLPAKAIATTVAATSSYFMNRHWTWRHRGRNGVSRELPLFMALSAVGLCITELCLVVSHYLLGFTSATADNVAANVVGLGLATTWRFLSFSKWVFPATAEV